MDVMSREETLKFLNAHVKTEMLMKHLYAVEPVAGRHRVLKHLVDRTAV